MTDRKAESGPNATPDVIASVFQQTPLMLEAWEAPDLRIVARNAAADGVMGAIFGDLGNSVWDVAWLRSSGVEAVLLKVLDTGEPFTAHALPLSYADTAGREREVYLDLTYSPWLRSDGTIRGILVAAADATASTTHRLVTEAESKSWQARFETSRDAMATLQSALLPPSVPVIPGLQIGARYLLAEGENSAGGDWFSAYATPSGRVALVVGDVVGHGVAASAAMGQLRAVVKERLITGASLPDALRALDVYAATLADADAATVCAALIDPATGDLEYCTAGHPPPLLVDSSGWRHLPTTGAGPLVSGRGFATVKESIPPDSLVLFYTDGLIERPGVQWSASTAEIGKAVYDAWRRYPRTVSTSAHFTDEVCEQALELLTRDTGFGDDITVLAIRRVPPPPELVTRLPAEPAVIPTAAAELDRWLADVGVGEGDQLRLRHAVVELVANSAEHGLSGRMDGRIDITARLERSGRALIEIHDNGHWKEPVADGPDRPSAGRVRGLGLPMVAQLVHGVQVLHDDTGTTVRLRQELRRPAPMIAPGPTGPRAQPVADLSTEVRIEVDQHRPDLMWVHGPVLPATAERLRTWIATVSRGGTRDLTMNLDDVSHLTSAGVRILQQAERAAHRHGNQLSLIARHGSVAHTVLAIVGAIGGGPYGANHAGSQQV